VMVQRTPCNGLTSDLDVSDSSTDVCAAVKSFQSQLVGLERANNPYCNKTMHCSGTKYMLSFK
jgi:hypothetical protein